MWLDELATAHAAAAPNWTTLLERCRLAFDPPLHEIVARFFLLFGHSEFWLRLPSVLFGLAAIGVLMLCVRRVFGARGAWYAGALFALNSRAILHSQDARMYALALFLAALSTYALIRVVEGAGRLWLAAYATSACLQGYNHIVYTSVLAGQIAVVVGLLLFSRERSRSLRRLLLAQALALAMLAPLTPLLLAIAAVRNRIYGFWTSSPDWAWLRDFFEWPEVSFALVTIPGIILLWRRRRQLRLSNLNQTVLLWLGIVYAAMWPGAVLAA
ncbi:MAG TPA: glycosyltransferase family 39 protein, partial [Bryobacterales bacterium]|nr:glycosyltransferase family 39 protein [Bryobacterales bacterium]